MSTSFGRSSRLIFSLGVVHSYKLSLQSSLFVHSVNVIRRAVASYGQEEQLPQALTKGGRQKDGKKRKGKKRKGEGEKAKRGGKKQKKRKRKKEKRGGKKRGDKRKGGIEREFRSEAKIGEPIWAFFFFNIAIMLPPLQRFDFGGGRRSSSKIAFMGCLREQKYARKGRFQAQKSALRSLQASTGITTHRPWLRYKWTKFSRKEPSQIGIEPRKRGLKFCSSIRLNVKYELQVQFEFKYKQKGTKLHRDRTEKKRFKVLLCHKPQCKI